MEMEIPKSLCWEYWRICWNKAHEAHVCWVDLLLKDLLGELYEAHVSWLELGFVEEGDLDVTDHCCHV